MANPKVDRRLYFTMDKSKIVEEGDPDAAFLAAVPDGPMDESTAKLVRKFLDGAPESDASTESPDTAEPVNAEPVNPGPVEDKAVTGPRAANRTK